MRRAPLLLLAALLLSPLAGCASVQRPSGEHRVLRLGMARQLVAKGEWRGAFELLNALHREDPEDAEVLTLRGVVYRETGLLTEAREELEQALLLSPDSARTHSALGILLDLAGDSERAVGHHRRAVELDGASAPYLNNLAFSDFARGRVAEAIAGFERALRLDPTNARIHNNLGFALARAGDFGRAAGQFARAEAPAQARLNLGLAHELRGNLALALEQYESAARLGAPGARAAIERVAALGARPPSGKEGIDPVNGEERR